MTDLPDVRNDKPRKVEFYEGEVMLLRQIRRYAFALRFDVTERKGLELDELLTEMASEWDVRNDKTRKVQFYEGEVMLLQKIRTYSSAFRRDATESRGLELDELLTEYYKEWEKPHGVY